MMGKTAKKKTETIKHKILFPFQSNISKKHDFVARPYTFIVGTNGKCTLEERAFVESPFKMQYYTVKNTLLDTAFSAILLVR